MTLIQKCKDVWVYVLKYNKDIDWKAHIAHDKVMAYNGLEFEFENNKLSNTCSLCQIAWNRLIEITVDSEHGQIKFNDVCNQCPMFGKWPDYEDDSCHHDFCWEEGSAYNKLDDERYNNRQEKVALIWKLVEAFEQLEDESI